MLALWISQNYQPDQSQPLVTTAPATTEIIQSKVTFEGKFIFLIQVFVGQMEDMVIMEDISL